VDPIKSPVTLEEPPVVKTTAEESRMKEANSKKPMEGRSEPNNGPVNWTWSLEDLYPSSLLVAGSEKSFHQNTYLQNSNHANPTPKSFS
jgi:hypothetical protein